MAKDKVKIYKYQNASGGLVDKRMVEITMKCLEALANEASDGQIGDDTLQPEALIKLRTHCRNPEEKIDSKLFTPLLHMMSPISGIPLGAHLFGPKWQSAIQRGDELQIADPDMRAIIAAAKPVVHIRHDHEALKDFTGEKARLTKMCLRALEQQTLPVKGD